ncbi:MAG: M20/M25/M40 family metallo-hydrolase [Bryobacteraceae bacterium]|nr:M20/M25/M40 family metallo-hydrolase [Bryobacteraceae bacterium]MDW8379062.1 M20/M25/M40 family metallo-hydrolase [Bryobacterales bacterium]
MDVFQLTRALVDIESITGNERRIGQYLVKLLQGLCQKYDGVVEEIEVEPNRFNVLACWGAPTVTFSTHMDTVPPFFPSREDDDYIWGRGACDTKGIIASMIHAIEGLLAEGRRNLALLLVVGEERNSAGAYWMSKQPRGSRYLINGEPTENQLALGSKGALRLEVITRGKMAHSAYPHLGESAIEKMLDILQDLRSMPLLTDSLLGPSTLNIGTISGGRAPNIVPDYCQAEILIRLVDDGLSTKAAAEQLIGQRGEVKEVLRIPALRLGKLEGFPTTVVAYTTDIPAFGGTWGQPFLLGPGTIHVAHTSEERVPKQQLVEAIGIYQSMAQQLLT